MSIKLPIKNKKKIFSFNYKIIYQTKIQFNLHIILRISLSFIGNKICITTENNTNN